MAAISLEEFGTLLERSRLLPNEDPRALANRWRTADPSRPATAEEFARWLTANQYLTEYQASAILRGHADRFFLNEYKLLERIGAGRMAGVFKAAHRLGQVVAVKVLPPSKAKDPQTFGRFQREARLAQRLEHVNIVRTFQVGEANGLHYLVMEFLEGETLEEVLQRRKRLPPAEAVRLVYQALRGLNQLNEEGIVHRDLKPGNLMLVPAPGPGQQDNTLKARVKILDIGLGRAIFDEAGPAEGADLTAPGEILGSPDYMAPEQARDSHGADVRADIYSLGCVLYHCLTGVPPFPTGNAVQKMIAHATTPPRPARELNPGIPDGLQQILDWMLAKDPAKRYPTPERAAQALKVFLAAAEDGPEAPPPQMQAYLKWLAAREGPRERPKPQSALPPPPVVAPVPVAAPVATPVARPVPPPRPAPPPKAAPRPAPPPMARPVKKPQADVELVPTPPAQGGGGVTTRDLLLLGIGAGGLLLIGLIVWLIFRPR
jgi:eukaryotic-like serine/threonine-protein kinase